MAKWSNKEINILKKYYPIEGYKVQERLKNRSRSSIYTKAMNIGLVEKYKSPKKLQTSNTYTDEEIEIIRKYFPTEGKNVALRIPNHTMKSISSKASSLGLITIKWRRWTDEEIDILKKYYPIEGLKCCDRIVGRDRLEITDKICALGLRLGKGTKIVKKERCDFTEKELDIIREYYPTEGREIMKRLPNHAMSSIYRRAKNMGLKRNNRSVEWSDNDVSILKEFYPIEGNDAFKRIPNHTEVECLNKISSLKLESNIWTEEEIDILRKYYPIEGSKVIKRLNGRTRNSIQKFANLNNIKYKNRVLWTEEETEIVIKYYHIEGKDVLKRLNKDKTEKSLYNYAHRLGLIKTKNK